MLCPKNEECNKLNLQILDLLPGQEQQFYSTDSVKCDSDAELENYPTEFLHSLTPNGMAPHQLTLKVNAIIILLRNLNAKKGLCNGTRLIIRQLGVNFIHAEVLTGQLRGEHVFIPRIELVSSDSGLPFQLQRRQFPVRLAFAMTINKAQGQTFDKIGVYLPQPVFSHGQLYVAFSRVRRLQDIKIQIENGQFQQIIGNAAYTDNVVYTEIL